MITVDTLTPVERSAYNEGYHDGVKEGITRGVNMMVDKCKPVMRALWLARAERAHSEAKFNHQMAIRYEEHKERTIAKSYDAEVHKWIRVERKCRAYADKFNEDK